MRRLSSLITRALAQAPTVPVLTPAKIQESASPRPSLFWAPLSLEELDPPRQRPLRLQVSKEETPR